MTALLSMRGVSYTVGHRRILHEVELQLAAGELVALIGPNGAGKSTALAVLAGDIRPGAGQVTIGDRAVRSLRAPELARRRSVLLQQGTVSFSYTVREVVAMARLPWQGSLAYVEADAEADWSGAGEQLGDDEIVTDALRRTDSLHLAGRDVTTLSGGEYARVALARALAQQCRVLLLDEPTDALDIGHQEQTMQIAVALAAKGGAVLAVLHDLGLAAAYADRIVVMSAGRVVACGAPRQVLTGELLSSVYQYPIEVIEHPQTGAPLVLPVRS